MNGMTEFRLHGRGGQGIVAAAAIFAEAVAKLSARLDSIQRRSRVNVPGVEL